MRRLLKFLHTLGAIGLMGALAALCVAIVFASAIPGRLVDVGLMGAMAKIATWIVFPSMVLTIIAGLLSIAVVPAFQDAGWAWAKAASGLLIFEGGLHVLGPIQETAQRGAGSFASRLDPESAARLVTSERNTLLVLLAVSAANVALGVWRPRLPNLPL